MVRPSFRVVKAYRCLAEIAAGETYVYCFDAIIVNKTEISLKK